MSSKDLTGPGEINALLGRGTEYRGKLTFEGRVRIDGRFHGEVFSDGVLIVGDGAEIRADLDVGTLIVLGGELWGEIRARNLVELHAPGRVHGNIRTPQIFVDRGVLFDGKCTMDGEVPPERHALESTSGEVVSGELVSSVEAALDTSGSIEIIPATEPRDVRHEEAVTTLVDED